MRSAVVIPVLVVWFVAGAFVAAQQPANTVNTGKPGGDARPRMQSVQFDASGWPIVPEDRAARAAPVPPPALAVPAGETVKAAPPRPAAGGKANGTPALASGMQLGSPLLEVYQATRAPGAWKELGGMVVWWRLTTYGPQGEQIGTRELTHTADSAFAERDRLDHQDGRVFGRVGAQVFVERQGMPWPTLAEQAQHELMLFGLHLRLPWCFGDASAFVVTGRDVEERNGERFARVLLERRPPPGLEVVGPEADPPPRDRFELLYEPSTGLPRELVHRFAASRQTRRVLLDDWRDVESVRLPYRRTYVDDSMRPTTVLEILRIERQRATERDFRLH